MQSKDQQIQTPTSSEEESDDGTAVYLHLLLDNNLDTDSRTYYLFGEINKESILRCIKGLSILEKSEGDINLVLNSEGGDVTAGVALIDFLFETKNKVIGIVLGEACSMASLILQACSHRVITPRSLILIHDGSAGIEGTINSVRAHAAYLQKDLEKTIDLYLRRAKISPKKLRTFLSTDTIFDAEQALKYGFVDEIKSLSRDLKIIKRKTGDLIKPKEDKV